MKARTGGAILAVGVIAAPLALIFSVGGDETEPELAGAGLDTKQIPAEYRTWIEKAAKTCKLITGPVLAAQIEAESNWNPRAQSYSYIRDPATGNVSKKPLAQGLTQFIPGTWKTQGVDAASKNGDPKPDGKADPFTPGDAIMTQAKYDCRLARDVQKRLKKGTIKGDPLDLTLAAYNAGIGAVDGAGGIPPFTETQNYVRKIRKLIDQYTADSGAPASGFGGRVVAAAKKQKGTPYAWGGGGVSGPSAGFGSGFSVKGFDCSSLVMYSVYKASHGKTTLPRTSQEQVKKGKPVSRSDMRPGDVIGFALHGGGNYDHIGIYMGNGRMIHAPKPGDVVKISSIRDPYYSEKPQKVRRFG